MERSARLSNAARRKGTKGAAAVPERRGTGRTLRGRRSRLELVRAARVVFERNGFLHARVADICHEAGMSHGSFYTYFTSKEEIFQEVVDSVEIDLLHLEPITKTAGPIERIRAANRHYLETYLRSAKILAVIQQVASFDAEVRKTRLQRQDEFARAIEKRIREYQASDFADPRVDAWTAANALGGMVAFVADQVATGRTTLAQDEVIEQLTVLWANALGLRSVARAAAPDRRRRTRRAG